MRKHLWLAVLGLLAACSRQPKTEEVVDTTLSDSNATAVQAPQDQMASVPMGSQGENLEDMADPQPPPPSEDQPTEETGVSHGPISASVNSLITADDYPPAALREGRGGITEISYRVDQYGRVIDCQLVDGTGSPDLDETACRLFTRRGRFQPATNEAGEPIVSEQQTYSVHWNPPGGGQD